MGPNNVKLGLTPVCRKSAGGATIAVLISTRVNHLLASPIVLLTFLTTVAFARAAARRDSEEYLVLETIAGGARRESCDEEREGATAPGGHFARECLS